MEYCAAYTAKHKAAVLAANLGPSNAAGIAARAYLASNPWANCQDTPVSAPGNGTGGVKKFILTKGSGKTLNEAVNDFIAELPDRYGELAQALDKSGLVDPSKVYISQYPTFSMASATETCSSLPFAHDVWEWLGTEGMKLNAAIATAAAAHGWSLIRVPAYPFYAHGYCSSSSWFVSLGSAVWDNLAGAFHATHAGAAVTAVQALRMLCPVLGDEKYCTDLPQLPS